MMQRWSNRLIDVLRANVRRGALFAMGGMMAITLTVTPLMTRPAAAQDISSLLSLGGSFTNGLSSCAIETVGWVICPTMRSIAKLADYGFTYINQNFLRIDYSIGANDGGTYKAWEIMRNIANALFVLAFMVLIYSQLTGRSAGGYNIKRLLPRLIICAILVNVSYYLCVALIDVSNILGDSVLGIFKELASRVGTSVMPLDSTQNQGFQDGTLSVITSSVMSKTGTAWVLLAPVAAVTISIATITAAGLILLIMRKTVIAMLILVSPLLFVAYLLPNLERFFAQGVRLFIQLLILYPIIALLLGTGQIVSATIVSVGTNDANYRVSGDSYFSKNGGSGSAITDLTAAAAAVLPLLGVWFIFKNMSSLMSTAGSRLSATVAGRRGDKDDKDARVTGKATVGAANNKSALGLNNPTGRRQAFSRNKRRKSLAGSSLTGGENAGAPNPELANRQAGTAGAASAIQNALDANRGTSAEDTAKKLEELQNAKIDGSAEGLNVDGALAAALTDGTQIEQKEKQKTAKDMFNDLNKNHESKDKDRKFSSGPAPAGSGGGQQSGGGSTGPTAPVASYKAPTLAQNNNIISGSAPATPTQTNVIAVPIQIDGAALLGQQAQHRPPENISQPPISGTQEKAKARAQQYLFEADKEIEDAGDKVDILEEQKKKSDSSDTDTTNHDKNNG